MFRLLRALFMFFVNLTSFSGNILIISKRMFIISKTFAGSLIICCNYSLLFLSELTAAVNASCTLNLVMPFVRSHSPIEFARQHLVAAFQHTCKKNASDTSESQTSFSNNQSDTANYCCENRYTGGSADWLKRLVPVMFSKQFEPRVLVAFHFAVEATLKSDMKCSHVSVLLI